MAKRIRFVLEVTCESLTFAAGSTHDVADVPASHLPGLLKAGHCVEVEDDEPVEMTTLPPDWTVQQIRSEAPRGIWPIPEPAVAEESPPPETEPTPKPDEVTDGN
jgi:hypothetical protein